MIQILSFLWHGIFCIMYSIEDIVVIKNKLKSFRSENRNFSPSDIPLYKNYFEQMLNKLDYFGDNTSLHGVKHAFSLSHIPFFKKLFWILVLSASGFGASVILRSLMALYSGEAVSYVLDTNYIDFETPFPAVTVCQQVDSGQAMSYIIKNGLPKSLVTFYKEVSFYYLKYCKTWCDCKMNVTCMVDFLDAVEQIRSPCKDIMTDCWFKGEHFPCCDRFLPLETEYGLCFTFNSRLHGHVLKASRRDGPLLPALVFNVKEEIGLRVHSPEDMVSVAMENPLGKPMSVPLITDLEIILKADLITSDQAVTPMTPAARSCLFPYEWPEHAVYWNFSRYTYSTCMLYCRAMAQYYYCNCTHHLMPRIRNLPFCNADEIQCLSKTKDQFSSYPCSCPMACEEVNYKVVHIFNVRHTKDVPKTLSARGSRVEIRLGELPNSMVRRVAIRHTLGLVVDIGGVAGVFFGASLLSILEIFYLFFIRRDS